MPPRNHRRSYLRRFQLDSPNIRMVTPQNKIRYAKTMLKYDLNWFLAFYIFSEGPQPPTAACWPRRCW